MSCSFERGIVPFMATQPPSTRDFPGTSSDHVLLAVKSSIVGATVLTHEMYSRPIPPPRNEMPHEHRISTGRTDIDIEDEYTILRKDCFDNARFTHEFSVYEQGQKKIIVKNRLRSHIEFWERKDASEYYVWL